MRDISGRDTTVRFFITDLVESGSEGVSQAFLVRVRVLLVSNDREGSLFCDFPISPLDSEYSTFILRAISSLAIFASDSFRTGEKNEFKILAHQLTEKNLIRISLFWADSLQLCCLI